MTTADTVDGFQDGVTGTSSPLHPRALRALTLLAASGGSFGLFVQGLRARAVYDGFAASNEGGAALRLSFSVALGLGVIVPVLFGVVAYLWRPATAREAVPRAADLLSPLVVTGLLPALFSWRTWASDPLPYLVTLGVFGLLLEWSLRRSFAALPAELFERLGQVGETSRLGHVLPLVVVLGGAIFYTAWIGHFTVLNHRRLGTSGFDLGINVNWCFNAMHGQLWRCPTLFGSDGGHFIGNHAIFAMLYWLPIFAVKPGAETLLWWQAFIVGFAAVPLYFFAKTQLSRPLAAIVACAYLFYAPVHGPNFYDYHELLPAMFWHFTLYWAIAERRYKLLPLLLPIIFAHREDVAVGVAVLGVFLALTGTRRRLGLILATVSVVWFVTIKFVIMPRLWTSWFADIYKELQAPGDHGYGSVVQTVLINPSYFVHTLLKEVKAVYALHLFAPLLFLPLRKPAFLLLAIPGFFFSLLTTAYPPTVSISFQYTTHWVPYLFAAVVLMLRTMGADQLGRIRRGAAVGAMSGAMVAHSFVFGAFFLHNTFVGGFSRIEFSMTQYEEDRYRELQRMKALIPPGASVAATENENPHIAARMNAYTLNYAHGDAEYLLVRGPSMSAGAKKNVQDALSKHDYQLVTSGHDLYLFKRGPSTPETERALSTLGFSARKAPPHAAP